MRSDTSFYRRLAAILDFLPLLPYACESIFSVNEFSALRGKISGIKTFSSTFMCSKTLIFSIFCGHFGFVIHTGFSKLSHFTLKTPDLRQEKQLSSAIMGKNMSIYRVSAAIFDFVL